MLPIDKIFKFIKVVIITFSTYYTTNKIMNKNEKNNNIIALMINMFIAIAYFMLKDKIGLLLDMIILIGLISSYIAITTNKSIVYSLICTTISLTINNILYVIASALIYIPSKLLNITNVEVTGIFINLVYILLVYLFFKKKKIKNGFNFLQSNIDNEYFEFLFLNVSAIALFSIILMINYDLNRTRNTIVSVIISVIVIFVTIQKSFKHYYKQKLLVQELENTKKDLEAKTKEIENLEAENIAISKKAHTLDHKQKSLAKKIDEMMLNTEISKEEVAEVKERLNKIGQDLYKEKTAVELSKTEIPEIDDMLTYMQSECSANKIDFELQIKGNIHYMTNNLITKEDLETLLADHIKNAIIAINHTDNINRSILVRLGEIDGIYSLYIYDSGIEFSKETLENLGKKPSTTHADEGGTGMGFMNTFDTLRKCKASLIIEEFNEPSKDNYTKAIIIKFDNKNEFNIKSYRQQTELK